jgi:hypothetical protein
LFRKNNSSIGVLNLPPLGEAASPEEESFVPNPKWVVQKKTIKEDFEKPPKTSGDATKVYKEESVTRSKSKSSKVKISI